MELLIIIQRFSLPSLLFESVDLIQGFALALLTLLIPLAVAVLGDFFQAEKRPFPRLDRTVFLSQIFKTDQLIFALALIFGSLVILGQNIDNTVLAVFMLTCLLYGFWMLIFKIRRVALWISDSNFCWQERLSHLRQVPTIEFSQWDEVWSGTIPVGHHDTLFEVFVERVEQTCQCKDPPLAACEQLLSAHKRFLLQTRTARFLTTEVVLGRYLQWYFSFDNKGWEGYLRGLVKNNLYVIWDSYLAIDKRLELVVGVFVGKSKFMDNPEFYRLLFEKVLKANSARLDYRAIFQSSINEDAMLKGLLLAARYVDTGQSLSNLYRLTVSLNLNMDVDYLLHSGSDREQLRKKFLADLKSRSTVRRAE